MSYQVLARKWRPRSFQQIVGQEHILRMLTNALDQKRLHHAYLFTGTQGIGKTTFARILAKCLNCEIDITATPCGTCKHCVAFDEGRFLDLFEIDAASRTKVEDTRELLENIHYPPVQGRFKIYLIDEVHMLSGHSFNALLKTLEEPPPYVKFLLATTDPKRLPATVLSRCLQFNLKQVPTEQIAKHLQLIATNETIPFEENAFTQLAQAANGSLRDALSLLDQAIAYTGANLTISEIKQMLGSIDQSSLFRLVGALVNQDGPLLLKEIAHLADYGVNFNQALEDLLSILHQMTIAQILPGISIQPDIISLAKHLSPEEIQLYYQIALIGRRDLALTPNPEQGFEMILLRMLAFRPAKISDTPKTQAPSVNESSTPSPALVAPTATPPIEKQISLRTWTDILSKLELTGMAYALAANCTLENMLDDKVTLALSVQHEPMCNTKLTARIEQALARYFNKPIQLKVRIVSDEMETPTKHKQKVETTRQTAATDAIKSDADVQKIMDIFNATLDVESIKAL